MDLTSKYIALTDYIPLGKPSLSHFELKEDPLSLEKNDEQIKMDDDFIESMSHLAWVLWEGNRPDETPLGETKWGTLADMFIQMKGLEIKHYG